MEELQLGENFTIDVTYYVGMGAFVHTIDGVSGADDWSTYWDSMKRVKWPRLEPQHSQLLRTSISAGY